jgi:hypothetical protein
MQEVQADPGGEAEALQRLAALTDPATAVFWSTDLLAIGELHTAYRLLILAPRTGT